MWEGACCGWMRYYGTWTYGSSLFDRGHKYLSNGAQRGSSSIEMDTVHQLEDRRPSVLVGDERTRDLRPLSLATSATADARDRDARCNFLCTITLSVRCFIAEPAPPRSVAYADAQA
ncbi:hypothetical protein MRB53_041342 [Persea americana]|nr:hypothetical protein MRB53_041342 [Persea americana]